MHVMAIVIVALIGVGFVAAVVGIPFTSEALRGRRSIYLVASALMLVGGLGFFGSGLSAFGGLNWLATSFEWPIGYSDGVVTTPEGVHVVSHDPSGRIQLYDANWRFIRGWHVDAAGGLLKVTSAGANRIEVITARGAWHYVFDMEGGLIFQEEVFAGFVRFLPGAGPGCVGADCSMALGVLPPVHRVGGSRERNARPDRRGPLWRAASMKIVIPGGTGPGRQVLVRALRRTAHEVVVLSRGRPSGRRAPWRGTARTLGRLGARSSTAPTR